MSQFFEQMKNDVKHSALQVFCRLRSAAKGPSQPAESHNFGSKTTTGETIDNKKPSSVQWLQLYYSKLRFRHQLDVVVSVGRELLSLGCCYYRGLLSCLAALSSLVMAPILPILSCLFCFKDADWNTWIARDKESFWKGKVAWVTGASSGIGESLAKSLAKRGVSLILSGRNEVALNRVKDSIVSCSTNNVGEKDVMILTMDMSDTKTIPQVVGKAIDFRGKVHMLFNNAGVLCQEAVMNTSWETTDDILKTNLLGPIRLTQEILPHMLQLSSCTSPSSSGTSHPVSNQCNIVFTNSTFGMVTAPCHTAYATSKHGLKAYARTLAGELAGKRSVAGLSTPLEGKAHSIPASTSTKGGKGAAESSAPTTAATSGIPSTTNTPDLCASGAMTCSVMQKLPRALLDLTEGLAGHLDRMEHMEHIDVNIDVTSVYCGSIDTDLALHRLDSKHRIGGVYGSSGEGKPVSLKPERNPSHDLKTGMSSHRCAELMLNAVCNNIREAWVANITEMMLMQLQYYAPDSTAILRKFVDGAFYRMFINRENETMDADVGSGTLAASTSANTSRNQLLDPQGDGK